jgi:hypothetical protein
VGKFQYVKIEEKLSIPFLERGFRSRKKMNENIESIIDDTIIWMSFIRVVD